MDVEKAMLKNLYEISGVSRAGRGRVRGGAALSSQSSLQYSPSWSSRLLQPIAALLFVRPLMHFEDIGNLNDPSGVSVGCLELVLIFIKITFMPISWLFELFEGENSLPCFCVVNFFLDAFQETCRKGQNIYSKNSPSHSDVLRVSNPEIVPG